MPCGTHLDSENTCKVDLKGSSPTCGVNLIKGLAAIETVAAFCFLAIFPVSLYRLPYFPIIYATIAAVREFVRLGIPTRHAVTMIQAGQLPAKKFERGCTFKNLKLVEDRKAGRLRRGGA